MKIYLLLTVSIFILSFHIAASDEQGKGDARYKRSVISKFLEKILRKLKHKDAGKKCFEKVRHGEIPSAELGDSPVTQFGYPFFNIRFRKAITNPGVTLSYMFGFRQPVKIGSHDYAIAGYPSEVLRFFACFGGYKVIGSSMNEDGHWVPDTGSIKIQVQNLDTKYGKSYSMFDILFKYSLDRIVKYLDPVKIIKGIDAQIMGGSGAAKDSDSMAELMEKVEEYLPGNKNLPKKILELFNKPLSLKEKVIELIKYINSEEDQKSELQKQWVDWENVNEKDKILVTLTMYPKPEHGCRSTYDTGKSTVDMIDIGEAIDMILEKKTSF